MTTGGGRTLTWNPDNQPTGNTSPGGNEQYSYDGDGERLTRTHGGVTTVYMAGVLEADVLNGQTTTTRTLYGFDGQTVATRTPSGLYYLHGDHLGSVSLSSTGSLTGTLASQQEFKPWGEVRSGGVGQTSLNYTGQRKDDTGLLYHHARYYDPVLARFTSADSIVPGSAMGAGGAMGTLGMDDKAGLRPLTVDFHEVKFASGLGEEDRFTQQKGFDFQLSKDDKKKAKNGQGPANPQALNRYSYVLNNPLRYTDPTGHLLVQLYEWGVRVALEGSDLVALAQLIEQNRLAEAIDSLMVGGLASPAAGIVVAVLFALSPVVLDAIAHAGNHVEIFFGQGPAPGWPGPITNVAIYGGEVAPHDISQLQPA